MDLLGVFGHVRKALSFFGGGAASDESWATDEAAFEQHFGVPYEAFEEIVTHLSREQENLLHATLEVNPEAAVLWILSMEEIES